MFPGKGTAGRQCVSLSRLGTAWGLFRVSLTFRIQAGQFETKKKKVLLQRDCLPVNNAVYLPILKAGSGGGIGRHARLRGVCRKACGFKSRPEHHASLSDSDSYAWHGANRKKKPQKAQKAQKTLLGKGEKRNRR